MLPVVISKSVFSVAQVFFALFDSRLLLDFVYLNKVFTLRIATDYFFASWAVVKFNLAIFFRFNLEWMSVLRSTSFTDQQVASFLVKPFPSTFSL